MLITYISAYLTYKVSIKLYIGSVACRKEVAVKLPMELWIFIFFLVDIYIKTCSTYMIIQIDLAGVDGTGLSWSSSGNRIPGFIVYIFLNCVYASIFKWHHFISGPADLWSFIIRLRLIRSISALGVHVSVLCQGYKGNVWAYYSVVIFEEVK